MNSYRGATGHHIYTLLCLPRDSGLNMWTEWTGLVFWLVVSAVCVLTVVCLFDRCVAAPRLNTQQKAVAHGWREHGDADAVMLSNNIAELLP